MGRPKGSKNKPKDGVSAPVKRGRPAIAKRTVAAKTGKRRGRPAGAVSRKPRAENVQRHEVVLRGAEAAEASTLLQLTERLIRLEQSVVQTNGYAQGVVRDVNSAITAFSNRLTALEGGVTSAPVEVATNGNGATHAEQEAATPVKAKRGRPAGSGSSKKAAAEPAVVEKNDEEDDEEPEELDEDDFEEDEDTDEEEDLESAI